MIPSACCQRFGDGLCQCHCQQDTLRSSWMTVSVYRFPDVTDREPSDVLSSDVFSNL